MHVRPHCGKTLRCSYWPCLPSGLSTFQRGNIPASAEKLCIPSSEGRLSLGRIFFFTPSAGVGGWRPVFIEYHMCQCQHCCHMHGLCTTLLGMCPRERDSSRRKKDNIRLLLSFMHLISQANMDTWSLSNQN